MAFISRMSTQTPPCSAWTWPSSEVPAPKGTSGAPWRAHTPTMRRGLLGARRVDDRVGRGQRMKRLVDAVLLEHVAPGEHPVGAQQRAQVVEQPLDGALGEASTLL